MFGWLCPASDWRPRAACLSRNAFRATVPPTLPRVKPNPIAPFSLRRAGSQIQPRFRRMPIPEERGNLWRRFAGAPSTSGGGRRIAGERGRSGFWDGGATALLRSEIHNFSGSESRLYSGPHRSWGGDVDPRADRVARLLACQAYAENEIRSIARLRLLASGAAGSLARASEGWWALVDDRRTLPRVRSSQGFRTLGAPAALIWRGTSRGGRRLRYH